MSRATPVPCPAPIRVLALSLLLAAALASPVRANVVETENARSGFSGWELENPAEDGEIEGYASLTSVNRGGQIRFYVRAADPQYALEVFRLGWYGGAGARRLLGPVTLDSQSQPLPLPDPSTGRIECEWAVSYTLNVPAPVDRSQWASGLYLVRLTGSGSGEQAFVPFVVRDDTRPSALLFQSSVTTFQAYNNWGGKSLYAFNSAGGEAAVEVSFDRPYSEASGGSQLTAPWQAWELNMARFLEREGQDVSYSTNIDTHVRGDLIRTPLHRAWLSVGHDEYWSREMRTNVERARDNGVSLGFFAANICFWQIRLDPNTAGAPGRTIVSYKDLYEQDPFYTDGNPSNDDRVTAQWRNPPLFEPEEQLVGVMYTYDPVDGDIVVETPGHWVFAGTGLQAGSLLPGLLGYEVDRMFGTGPPGTVRLARSPFATDFGTDYSDMTVYTATPSGATVFATGSIQWSWGLDDYGVDVGRTSRLQGAAQRITRNVLARFVAPRVAITMPAAGASWTVGSQQTIVWRDNLYGVGTRRLMLSRDGGASWTVLGRRLRVDDQGVGRYTWTVTGPASTAVRIRVAAADELGTALATSANFEIRAAAIRGRPTRPAPPSGPR